MKWTQFVKEFAYVNGIPYMEAVGKAKESYRVYKENWAPDYDHDFKDVKLVGRDAKRAGAAICDTLAEDIKDIKEMVININDRIEQGKRRERRYRETKARKVAFSDIAKQAAEASQARRERKERAGELARAAVRGRETKQRVRELTSYAAAVKRGNIPKPPPFVPPSIKAPRPQEEIIAEWLAAAKKEKAQAKYARKKLKRNVKKN